MKKIFIGICMFGMLTLNISPLLAGGIDNKHNWSAEYIRTLNRNAATDSADIVAYNPAGIMKMANGAYVNFSVQGVFKTYENTVDGIEFESDVSSYIPGVFSIYKQDKWAAFAGFTIPAGGGKVEYDNGNATTMLLGTGLNTSYDRGTDTMVQALGGPAMPLGTYYGTISSQNLDAQSYYLGFTFGGAYRINDMISFSLGTKFVSAKNEGRASVTISPTAAGIAVGATNVTANADYEEDDDGWGGIIGLNISPTEKVNIGIRYETKIKLDFKATVNQDNLGVLPSLGLNHGATKSRDLPALLALGFSHRCTPKFRVETNFTYYFNEEADWDGDEENADNGYDVGIALEFAFNEKIIGSLGYMYTDVGIKPEDILPESPQLNASTVGAGFVYKPRPALDLNFAVGKVFYKDDSFVSQPTESTIAYDKDIIFLAFGIQYKFI